MHTQTPLTGPPRTSGGCAPPPSARTHRTRRQSSWRCSSSPPCPPARSRNPSPAQHKPQSLPSLDVITEASGRRSPGPGDLRRVVRRAYRLGRHVDLDVLLVAHRGHLRGDCGVRRLGGVEGLGLGRILDEIEEQGRVVGGARLGGAAALGVALPAAAAAVTRGS